MTGELFRSDSGTIDQAKSIERKYRFILVNATLLQFSDASHDRTAATGFIRGSPPTGGDALSSPGRDRSNIYTSEI